jgi:hypothetical protein
MQLAAGTRLGSFEIVAPLGAGGMGEVYRARGNRRYLSSICGWGYARFIQVSANLEG